MVRRRLATLGRAPRAVSRRLRFLRWSRTIGDAYLAAQFPACPPVAAIHRRDDMLRVYRERLPRPEAAHLHYYKSGRDAFRSIENVLDAAEKPLGSMANVLDFAAGFGRVSRFVVRALDDARGRLQCSEILPDAVRFLREQFGVKSLQSAPDPRAVHFDDAFDLVFATSLFTHLPVDTCRAWLAKLYGALAPDGLLVFSTHGPANAPAPVRDASRYVFHAQSETTRLDGRRYGTAFIPPAMVRAMLRDLGAPHVYTRERDLWSEQDLHVASPRAIPGLDAWPAPTIVDGALDRLVIEKDGRVVASGWAADRRSGAPVDRITLLANGRSLGNVTLDHARPDVSRALARPTLNRAGFELIDGVLDVSTATPILAVAESHDERTVFDACLAQPRRATRPT